MKINDIIILLEASDRFHAWMAVIFFECGPKHGLDGTKWHA